MVEISAQPKVDSNAYAKRQQELYEKLKVLNEERQRKVEARTE